MSEEEKDQSQETEKSEESQEEKAPDSLFGEDGFWDKGKKFLEEEEIAKEEEDECPDCDKEKGEPLLVIERKGKKIPIYSQDELKEYASKGIDYTQKTQELAEDKRKIESQLDEKMSMISDLADRINKAYDARLKTAGGEDGKETKERTVESVMEDYGLDEFSDPVQRKMVETIFNLENKLEDLSKTNAANKSMIDMFTTRETVTHIGRSIEEARKEYPFEEVMDENGKNLTARQFVRMFKAKTDEEENKGRDVGQVAKETVKELYFIQQASKGDKPTEQDVKGLSVEDFVKKYPDLATKIKEQGVADHLAVQRESPPDLKAKKREVDLARSKSKKDQPQSLDEYLEKAKLDPEITFE